MRMRISYRSYPLSKKLDQKSLRIATLTQPLTSMAIGVVPGMACAFLFPNSVEIPMTVMMVGMVGGLVLGPVIRKKMYAKMDAEYARIQRSVK